MKNTDPNRKKRILVVDDEVALVELLRMRLEFLGFEVIAAYDGPEALEKSRSESPDLILLDLMLPKLDGYRVCKMLKFDEKYQDIPIIMLTALAQESDVKLGLELGADMYFTKPFQSDQLVAAIHKLLAEAENKVPGS